MSEITGGELFARCLASEGIEHVFGLPSPEIDPLFAQLEKYGIRLVPVRHESAGVHMAEGLYKSTGKASCVIGNPGPGAANLLPGIFTALHEGVPVLAITSQHRMGVSYPTPPSTFQGQDQLDSFQPAVKWGGPIFEWARIPEVLRLAFREMWNGRPGPVHVDVPVTVMYDLGEEDEQPILEPEAYRPSQPQASAAQIEAAADLLESARRPVVVAGAGVDRAGANAEAAELAEVLGCPLIPTQAGRASARADHPNYVFGFGEGGIKARLDADVILVAGSRIGNLDLPYDKYWGEPGTVKLIQIDTDPSNIGVTRPLTMGIVADAADALGGIAAELKRRGKSPSEEATAALAEARETDARWHASQASTADEWEGEGIHPARAIEVIGETFGDQAIYTVDGGLTAVWAYAGLPPTGPRSYHSILELGMLGTGIPSAIGSKIGQPDREVVCVTGDGAAGFNIMEMQSAVRDSIPVTVIVFAEGAWTMEEPNELALFGHTFGTEQGEIRWDMVAEGLGCHGEFVDQLDDLGPALGRCRDSGQPSVVCLKTDRDANRVIPPAMAARWMEVQAGPIEGV
ncbi:MAG: thiamine pyrophosphate-binding protein [Solirubrobacterales bacterium]|nr:thiamine pyrophosphate-binding protein [Solirubrobacterales bacterium]MCB0860590.1 thiamine pyrophosphate-binding protein [Solirubrobacterales bacterium]HRV59695.1 thiamine pyrophosphate-binding protein [Solirubrobacterales bacterium]